MHLLGGFPASWTASPGFCSTPLPPVVTDVPTSSVAIVADAGRSKSALTSQTSLACPAQRQLLVVGLEGRGPAGEERLARLADRVLRDLVGPVVVDLVVVEHDDPRERRVRRPQVGVGRVVRVPPAVLRSVTGSLSPSCRRNWSGFGAPS